MPNKAQATSTIEQLVKMLKRKGSRRVEGKWDENKILCNEEFNIKIFLSFIHQKALLYGIATRVFLNFTPHFPRLYQPHCCRWKFHVSHFSF